MSGTNTQPQQMLRAALCGMAALALGACTSIYRDHGYVPTDEELAEIVIGVDTRDSVAESFGTPASTGVLDDSGYYYVSTRIRHYGALAPQIVDRQLVAISFDRAGVVQNVERFDLDDGRRVPLQRRVTSSSVSDKTFLRQLLGNIGNFNPGALLE